VAHKGVARTMYKIAVFGFYEPDQARVVPDCEETYLSPVDTESFMRLVWEMEPAESRIGRGSAAPCFVKLTGVASQPVYVQSLSDRMAPGAALLRCDGYVVIIDAVKILAPRAIGTALRRIAAQHPDAHVFIAAGRQNEPDALSSVEIRQILGLHPDLPVYPYVPTEPKTVQRLIRRLARYIDDPQRCAPPIFAGEVLAAAPRPERVPGPHPAPEDTPAPALPQVHGITQVGIAVADLARSLDFYRGLLGFRVLGEFDWPPTGLTVTHLAAGRTLLELVSGGAVTGEPDPPGDPIRPGARHITLHVTGLDAIVEQLVCADVPLIYEPDRLMDGVRLAVVADPDGTPVVLVEGEIVYTRR